MRHFMKTSVRGLGLGAFWAVALLVLPNCALDSTGVCCSPPPEPNLNKGSLPRNGVIFCDIEKMADGEPSRHCATDQDLEEGIPLTDAAVALNEGRTSNIGLDYSEQSLANCNGGPEAVVFEGPFPEGFAVCLNCGEAIGPPDLPDVNKACQNQCYDLFGTIDSDGTVIPFNPPSAAVAAFCDASAKASTNQPNDSCLSEDACPDAGGAPTGTFTSNDPRRIPEPVQWQEPLVGTAAGPGGTLTRTALTSGNYDAGAVSTQWFTKGNAFVEFNGGSAGNAHFIGLSEVPANCAVPCPDPDQNFTTLGYAFALGGDQRIYIYVGGDLVTGPGVNGSFGTYTASDWLRVSVTDKSNGTAEVIFGKVMGSCMPGTPCTVEPLHTASETATYPLRVDTSFFDQGSTVTDVRVVFIK